MSRRPQREGRRRPRVPGWLLAALVIGCLATAGWLFWADARLDDASTGQRSATEEPELAESELQVPEDEASTGETSRRSDAGRDRLDPEDPTVTTTVEDGDATASEPDPLPPVLANLAGRTIALLPASASARGRASRQVRVGSLRIPCAALADAERIAAEVALLERVRDVLERAGATVMELAASDGTAGCVDVRARALADADLGLVLQSGGARGRVLAGRSTSSTSAAATSEFASQLAGALDVAAPPARPGTRDARLLARVGALDIDGSGTVAFVEPAELDDEAADAFALAVARAMALTLARAGAGSRG